MARQEKDEYVKIGKICKKYDISKKYLESLLAALKRKGYVETKTSRGGGYKLAMPASKVMIAEIVRLFDGALAPTASASKYFYRHTPIEKEVKLLRVMREIRRFTAKKLENLALSDLT